MLLNWLDLNSVGALLEEELLIVHGGGFLFLQRSFLFFEHGCR
jgi:hypothetical protein